MTLPRETFPVGRLGCNCTVVVCPRTGEALVVDPGDDVEKVRGAMGRLGATHVAKVVHTHAHLDHVLASAEVARPGESEILLHSGDRWLWDNVPLQGALFGWSVAALAPPTGALTDDQTLAFGDGAAQVIHTPGHTPGSVCFLLEADAATPILLSGDTLFRGSVGRTDLWGTSFEELARSIRERLFTLPGGTTVIPGHGPGTTIARETEENPFVGRRAGGDV